jgi:hypothetical protein
MKEYITLLLFSLLLIDSTHAQKSTIAIHIYNPIGMYHKAGMKLEFRTKRMGFLVMGIKYYGSLPKYPGTQTGIAFRLYSKNDEGNKHENFLYAKAFAGHQEYFAGEGNGFLSKQAVPESNYYGPGLGWGKHFNFNHFFIDLNTGIKFAVSNPDQRIAFHITGPGSYLDLHFNLGFQF